MTDEDFEKLDDMAKHVGRMVSAAEAVFPVTEWSASFRELLYKSRDYEPLSKFVIHHNARDRAALDYKNTLPPGMASNDGHEAWLKNQPWSPLVLADHVEARQR
ncbi:unnamed protein product [Pylaiella littoralis]